MSKIIVRRKPDVKRTVKAVRGTTVDALIRNTTRQEVRGD